MEYMWGLFYSIFIATTAIQGALFLIKMGAIVFKNKKLIKKISNILSIGIRIYVGTCGVCYVLIAVILL